MLMKIFYFITLWLMISACVYFVMCGEDDGALGVGFLIVVWFLFLTLLND